MDSIPVPIKIKLITEYAEYQIQFQKQSTHDCRYQLPLEILFIEEFISLLV